MTGTLVIRPVSAQLVRDNEIFGKMDPFCIIKTGIQKQKTKIHNNGGKFPTWKETFKFEVTQETFFRVEVWDKDLIKDDIIGQCDISLKTIIEKNSKSKDWYAIYYKGKISGEVYLETEWIPSQTTPVQGNAQHGMNMTVHNQWGFNPHMAPPTHLPPPFYYQNAGQVMFTQPMLDQTRHSQPVQQPLHHHNNQYIVYPMICQPANNQYMPGNAMVRPNQYMMQNQAYAPTQQMIAVGCQTNVDVCFAPPKHELG